MNQAKLALHYRVHSFSTKTNCLSVLFLILMSLGTIANLNAQTVTPSQSIILEASTNNKYPTGYGRNGSCIFPNGKIGVSMNNNLYRIYEPNGTLTRTINLATAVGFAPRKVIGLSNNRILILSQTAFAIIDQNGTLITPETYAGMTNYFNNFYLDAVELSNGDLAISQYNGNSAPEVRVMTQAGASVSSPMDIKTNGTGRPTPQFNQFYDGSLVASKDGGFLFIYKTYLMGIWGVLFNNDGTMRTWPQNGMNHRKLSPANQEYCDLYELPSGGYMLQFPWNKTANLIIDGSGNTVTATLTRPYFSSAIAINHKASNGYYVNFATGENIGQNWDGSDDFTGNAGILAEVRQSDGTVAIPSTQIGTAFFDVQYWADEWYYWPDTRPVLYPVWSLRGAAGYGLIIQDYAPDAASFSLTLQLYETGLSTLPVKLESFTGKSTPTGNLLNWSTSAEINAKHFAIEYSSDGTSFTKIGEVAAGKTKYEFLHRITNTSTSYYRLRIVDIDGTSDLSKVVKIAAVKEITKAVTVYPVPARDYCWVEVSDMQPGKRIAYRIVNTNGAAVKTGFITEAKQKITLGELGAGIYYLHTADYGTQKIVIR